jgi:HK97 family phage prohead protease
MKNEGLSGAQRRYISLKDGNIEAVEVETRDGEETKKTFMVSGTPVLYNRMTTLIDADDFIIREIIDAGAAREALGNAEQVLLWNHNSDNPMAARKNNTLTVREDENGVHIDADVSGSAWGRDGYEAIRSGLVDSMSFAFFVKRDGYTIERTEVDKKQIITRTIHKFSRIIDFSPVTYAAFKDTDISARGAEEILMEAEKEKRAEVHEKIDGLLKEFKEFSIVGR